MSIKLRNLLMLTLSCPPPLHFYLEVNFSGKPWLKKDAKNSFFLHGKIDISKNKSIFLNEQGPTQGTGLL